MINILKKVSIICLALTIAFPLLLAAGCAETEAGNTDSSADKSSVLDEYDGFFNSQKVRAVTDRTEYSYEDDIVIAVISDDKNDILGTAPCDFYIEYWDSEKGEWLRSDKQFSVQEIYREHKGDFTCRIEIKYRVDKGRLGMHRVAYELHSGEFGKVTAYSGIFEMIE